MKTKEKQPVTDAFPSFVGRVSTWVLTISILLAALAAWRWGREEAYAILFAGILSVINMLILGNRLMALPASPQGAILRIWGAVMQRWAVTIVGLILAIVWLHLPIIGLVAGLLVTHFVFLAFLLRERNGERS